ncbi:MAG: cytochrome-c peroxidase [bacterium]|nr:MAG: cytochrome-c peroxidase [bacterium]
MSWKINIGIIPALLLLTITPGMSLGHGEDPHHWTEEEITVLGGLSLDALPDKPSVPSNRFADDPGAARLGKEFFFDKTFSGNSQVSCGTCHRPDYAFTDNLPLAHGMGFTARRTMPLAGAAYFPWLFWDGRKDSLWSQALGPIESTVEHGISRTFVIKVILERYRSEYEAVFGGLPGFKGLRKLVARPGLDSPEAYKAWITIPREERENINRVYANFGKAIEAYVRTIIPGPSRFDDYIRAVLDGNDQEAKRLFTPREAEGLRLFIGKAKCTGCHTGPLLTNSDFHNVNVPDREGSFDRGRADGIIAVLSDEFNCLGSYSDAQRRQCGELRFIDTDTEKYAGAFKTPTLRNVADRPPYMHAGQIKTLREVLEFYGRSRNPELGHGGLTKEEIERLEAFLVTLSGPILSLED